MQVSDAEFMRRTLSKKRKNWGKLAAACLGFGAILGFLIGKGLS